MPLISWTCPGIAKPVSPLSTDWRRPIVLGVRRSSTRMTVSGPPYLGLGLGADVHDLLLEVVVRLQVGQRFVPLVEILCSCCILRRFDSSSTCSHRAWSCCARRRTGRRMPLVVAGRPSRP